MSEATLLFPMEYVLISLVCSDLNLFSITSSHLLSQPPDQFARAWGQKRTISAPQPYQVSFLKIGCFLVNLTPYWPGVNGWLFQNVSNYVSINSGWSEVTAEQFASVSVKNKRSQPLLWCWDFFFKMARFWSKCHGIDWGSMGDFFRMSQTMFLSTPVGLR